MQNPDLLLESYNYELDPSMIADRPVPGRHNSKLLVYLASEDRVIHTEFKNLPEFLTSEHMLVMNESKVFPCRLIGKKASGGKAEIFLLSLLHKNDKYPAMIGANGKKNIGDRFFFEELVVTIEERSDEGAFIVSFNKTHDELLGILQTEAKTPIPPYIRGGVADKQDIIDYQTVYANSEKLGSVAAPTAGLHYTDELFASLEAKGIESAKVTLHVGAGTFKPVSADNILDHKMHKEYYEVDKENLAKLNLGKKHIAVGTTSLRVIESIYNSNEKKFAMPSCATPHWTDIFLYPGREVRSIAGLQTNFHLPKSTLLMLVSSLIGRAKTLELYEIAKESNYRFFSYGDAMLILR